MTTENENHAGEPTGNAASRDTTSSGNVPTISPFGNRRDRLTVRSSVQNKIKDNEDRRQTIRTMEYEGASHGDVTNEAEGVGSVGGVGGAAGEQREQLAPLNEQQTEEQRKEERKRNRIARYGYDWSDDNAEDKAARIAKRKSVQKTLYGGYDDDSDDGQGGGRAGDSTACCIL